MIVRPKKISKGRGTIAVKQRSGPETSVRVGALVAVTLLHLPFILAKRSRERPPTSDASLLVRFIAASPAILEPVSLVEPQSEERTISPRERVASRARIAPLPATTPSEQPRIDWYSESAEASEAAIAAIVREESYRSLGPREKRFQIVEPKAPPPLFEEPKHRSGDIAPNPMGYESVWYNEHCFTQLEQPVIPHLPRVGGPGVNAVNCMWPMGKREPRGDLFEHLKKNRDKAPLPGETPKAQ